MCLHETVASEQRALAFSLNGNILAACASHRAQTQGFSGSAWVVHDMRAHIMLCLHCAGVPLVIEFAVHTHTYTKRSQDGVSALI